MFACNTDGHTDEESKRIRLAALLKIVNILLQLKIQVSETCYRRLLTNAAHCVSRLCYSTPASVLTPYPSSIPQTGQAPSDADQERVKACVMEAKGLFPTQEDVLMLDAESAASEGQFDAALEMMDSVVSSADPTDSLSTIIKANILMQKVSS